MAKPKRGPVVRTAGDGSPLNRHQRRRLTKVVRQQIAADKKKAARAQQRAAHDFDRYVAGTISGKIAPADVPHGVKQAGLALNGWTTRGDGYWEGGALGMALPLDEAWAALCRHAANTEDEA